MSPVAFPTKIPDFAKVRSLFSRISSSLFQYFIIFFQNESVMRRSIRNFNIPPPRAYPGHLTLHRARGGGNLNLALEGWGI